MPIRFWLSVMRSDVLAPGIGIQRFIDIDGNACRFKRSVCLNIAWDYRTEQIILLAEVRDADMFGQ
jgi:hypothetical protein